MSIWGGVLFTKDNTLGFTLIELLAVIVILAVIALIATPIVLNIIEQARYGAAKSSAIGYVEASEKGAILYLMENKNNKITGDCTAKSNVLTCGSIPLTLDVKGSLPSSGTITFDNNGNVNTVTDLLVNGYKFSYSNGKWTGEKDSSGTVTPPPVEIKGKMGDYVNYTPDNENWNIETDGVSESVVETNGTFNIYDEIEAKSVIGQSKNNGIVCKNKKYNDFRINGWQIMNVSSSGQITLIHAGTPECYYFEAGKSAASVDVLGSSSKQGNETANKAWTKYGNSTLADSVHYINTEDYNSITYQINKNNDYKITNNDEGNNKCYNEECSSSCGNEFIFGYFLIASTYNTDSIYSWSNDTRETGCARLGNISESGSYGIRPVVVLKSNVKITEDAMDGTEDKPYNLTI